VLVSEVGRPMYGWNFLEPEQVKPRNELRRCSQADQEEEETESIEKKIDRFRTIIVDALRDFPDAYRAVVERLRLIPTRGGT
jgi:hypothetical protein